MATSKRSSMLALIQEIHRGHGYALFWPRLWMTLRGSATKPEHFCSIWSTQAARACATAAMTIAERRTRRRSVDQGRAGLQTGKGTSPPSPRHYTLYAGSGSCSSSEA